MLHESAGNLVDSRIPLPAGGLIALDADGVLIDYHEGYAKAWEQAFGVRPQVRDPNGYHPLDYWDVPLLTGARLKHLQTQGFTAAIWGSMPAMPGALEACELLSEAGFRLVCVTALEPRFARDREANLRDLGFKLDAVHAVGKDNRPNPKATLVAILEACAMVDDFLPFLQDLPAPTWRALIAGRPHNSPNTALALEPAHSTHQSLLDFAERVIPYR